MIIIVRHGQTYWNMEKKLQGWKNSNLTEIGIQQAINVSSFLEQFLNGKSVNVFISPLGREFYITGGIDTHVPIKYIDKNEYTTITIGQFKKAKKINI